MSDEVITELRMEVARLGVKVGSIETQLTNLVTKPEFLPVRNIAFSLAGLVLSSVVVAFLRLIFIKGLP
ncbi:MAG: hypothetical protein ACRD9Q_02115 [Nitrososphaeraceae archaeon]